MSSSLQDTIEVYKILNRIFTDIAFVFKELLVDLTVSFSVKLVLLMIKILHNSFPRHQNEAN